MLSEPFSQLDIYVFCKDTNGRFLFCNEKFAEAAGIDSPSELIGKTDYDLIWREQAPYFQAGDQKVLAGEPFVNKQEVMLQRDKIATVLTSSKQFIEKDKCLGVIGHFVDITGFFLNRNVGYFDSKSNRFYLGDPFKNVYLCRQQYKVFKLLLLGYAAKKIANLLHLSTRTIEFYIDTIKKKLDCKTKHEIIAKVLFLDANVLASMSSQETV
jgi:PAS domain S-box-containing protein